MTNTAIQAAVAQLVAAINGDWTSADCLAVQNLIETLQSLHSVKCPIAAPDA